MAEQIHAKTHTRLFRRVVRHLTGERKQSLDRLLACEFASRQTAYNCIERHAKRPSH
jgi:hypothetical protein